MDGQLSKIETIIYTIFNDQTKQMCGGHVAPQITMKEYNEYYTMIFTICRSKGGNKLYDIIMNSIDNITKNIYKNLSLATENTIMNIFCKYWNDYQLSTKFINCLFNYMNENYIKNMKITSINYMSIYQLCMSFFKNNIIVQINDRIIDIIFNSFDKIKSGESGDMIGIYEYIKCTQSIDTIQLDSLSTYRTFIETPYIVHSKQYYNRICNQLLTDTTSLIQYIARMINVESEIAIKYFHSSSTSIFNLAFNNILIGTYVDTIINDFIKYVINDDSLNYNIIYTLINRLGSGSDRISTALEKYIITSCNNNLKQISEEEINKPNVYFKNIIATYHYFDNIIKKNFNSDMRFIKSLASAFTNIVNENIIISNNPKIAPSGKGAEFIAKYTDIVLKKSNTEHDNDTIDTAINDIATVFKYIKDKDIFQKFYHKFLASRLIYNSSFSEDAEKSMIVCFKNECGTEFIIKFQRMIDDMNVSKNLLGQFKAISESSKINFNPYVLTSGSWPFKQTFNINLPDVLNKLTDNFITFYNATHQNRKLTWLHNISKGELVFKPNGVNTKYILSASTIQIAILYCFNDMTNMNLQSIKDIIGVDETIIKANMDILVKSKIMKQKDDDYIINDKYNNKKTHVKIDVAIKIDNDKEQESTKREIDADRKFIIDACIVRIMKTRKDMDHMPLVDEVITQLNNKFKPDIKMIKACIESLIDREYMKRVQDSRNKYQYVA